MHFHVFAAGAVAYVNAELEHGKTIIHHFIAELGVVFPVFLGFGRKVEKYEYPHNAIFIEPGSHGC
jgi:hypothetical protein